MAGHQVGPRWAGSGGVIIDTTNVRVVAKQKVVDLDRTLREADETVESLERQLKSAQVHRQKVAESLDYWKTAMAIAIEVDKRLDEGEEVVSGGDLST